MTQAYDQAQVGLRPSSLWSLPGERQARLHGRQYDGVAPGVRMWFSSSSSRAREVAKDTWLCPLRLPGSVVQSGAGDSTA